MRQDNKDWIDAIREKTLSDGAASSPSGWEAIDRRVRRGAALRRGALAAAVVLPFTALLLWSPLLRHSEFAPESPSAAVAAVIPESSSVSPEPSIVIPDPIGDLPADESPASSIVIPATPTVIPAKEPESPALAQRVVPSSNPARNEDKQPGNEAPSSKQAQLEDEIPADEPETPAPSTKQVQNVYEGAKNEPTSTKQAQFVDETPAHRHRTRVSVGLRAGTNAIRREAGIAMRSSPYIATLAYMNTLDPGMLPQVKSTTSNTVPYEIGANTYFPESASATYRHDLPLTVGLHLGLDLLPWLGLESGIEYTYLHSIQNSAAGTWDQRLHFIGIPLRVDFRIWHLGAWDLYAGVGTKLEKCVSASLGRIACEEPRLQWSAETFGGIQLRVWNHTHLYFQPALSWYLTQTDLITYRTENPFGFSMNAGLRFDL